MAHEELKAQYEIDKQYSDNPGQYWEFKTCYEKWIDAYNPRFLDNVEYRRKPDAPVWTDDKEDARKWRELVELASESGGISFEKFKEIRDGKKVEELIQGYTSEQWQTIIDGKFLCEFSSDKNNWYGISTLTHFALRKESDSIFTPKDGVTWRYCRPLRTKGVRQPWFGGECPVNENAYVYAKYDSDLDSTGRAIDINWRKVIEFIEL